VKGEKAEMEIDKDDLPVYKVSFRAKESTRNSELGVSLEKSKPSSTEEPPAEIYKYLKFERKNLEDVEDIRIDFKIEKEWFSENNLDPDSVILLRHTEDWEELNTYNKGDNSEFYYYRATSPGFSYFAISAEEIVEEVIEIEETPKNTTEVNTTRPIINNTVTVEMNSTNTTDNKITGFVIADNPSLKWALGAVVALVVFVVFVVVINRKSAVEIR
jgi:PGF-pre-PGF domain-containing protein